MHGCTESGWDVVINQHSRVVYYDRGEPAVSYNPPSISVNNWEW